MHELSLAKDIVDIISKSIPGAELKNVNTVLLKAGEISGVVTDSLKFAYEAVVSGSELQSSKLEIIDVPFRIMCSRCKHETTNEFGMLICSDCGSGDTQIISGNELQVVEVRLNEFSH
jgi:hydrogenase nickel incorporation protein HypA/HybF